MLQLIPPWFLTMSGANCAIVVAAVFGIGEVLLHTLDLQGRFPLLLRRWSRRAERASARL